MCVEIVCCNVYICFAEFTVSVTTCNCCRVEKKFKQVVIAFPHSKGENLKRLTRRRFAAIARSRDRPAPKAT